MGEGIFGHIRSHSVIFILMPGSIFGSTFGRIRAYSVGVRGEGDAARAYGAVVCGIWSAGLCGTHPQSDGH